jgi:hypothetical protein
MFNGLMSALEVSRIDETKVLAAAFMFLERNDTYLLQSQNPDPKKTRIRKKSILSRICGASHVGFFW